MILLHAVETRMVGRMAHQSMALLPIAPIVILPFIIIFFVVVFPLWGVSLGVVGALYVIVLGLKWLLNRAGSQALDGAAAGLYRAFRWVLTWGGFTERLKKTTTT